MDDSVQILCTRCNSSFREKARKIQIGYSTQCPGCEIIIFFEEGNADKNIQKAFKDAQNLRRKLRREEEARIIRRAVVGVEQTEEQTEERSVDSARHLQSAR